ncbi:MAG: peptidyl-prolyl cis-trans isomerase [Bacilli bacterium]|nr:peptidyl-prolyl cis-trans isomerase [Bacilli bacterium]
MKKTKLTLGIVTALLSIGALAACNEVTYSEGVVLTYTDAQGNRVDFTAKDLFNDYQKESSAASTDFNKVKEVLIRNYYNASSQATALAELKAAAQKDVNDDKKSAENNASSNGTTYQEEFEKILSSNGCDNVDQLYELRLYEEEKTRFEREYSSSDTRVAAMRDGYYINESGEKVIMFPDSEDYGPGSDGYLEEKLPYHVAHFLITFAGATASDFTSIKVTESEAIRLSQAMKELAGASKEDGITPVTERATFGDIAKEISEDTGSGAEFGDLGIMDKGTSFVSEFKLGVYAYDALYNKTNKTEDNAAKLLPSEDATILDPDRVVGSDDEIKVTDYFANRGIGKLPYGAALAMAATAKNPEFGFEVNENSETYYPRNIIFNKYFNNHQIAVITPNSIPYNEQVTDPSTPLPATPTYDVTEEADLEGTYNATYAALPGFQVDTTGLIDNDGHNVLTDSLGRIVLAVRGDSKSGIHFITVTRSALDEYVLTNYDAEGYPTGTTELTESEYEAVADDEDATSLSEYYTFYKPSDDGYPVYGDLSDEKSTYVNEFNTGSSGYSERANEVRSAITGYNSNQRDTFIFQYLIENGESGTSGAAITFANEQIGNLIKSYIQEQRTKAVVDTDEDFDDAWSTYAELLTRQDEARTLRDDGQQNLISEVCAIGYGSEDGAWAKGGVCYNGK